MTPVPIPGDPNEATQNYEHQRIGQYLLLRQVGGGGGGDVYEARHLRLNRQVAVKILSKKLWGNESARQRFEREMVSIGQLEHPHVVRAFDAGEIEGIPYLAMEFVDGENLEHLASRVGRLRTFDACEVVRQAALGLQHIHEHNLIHRDIKPSNLLLFNDVVKIADLGLARLIDEGPLDLRLTRDNAVVGTADYMAPEQAEGSLSVDIRADIYSLGCTLYRFLAGRPPFADRENNTAMKKMWAHARHPIPDIRTVRPDVSPELSALLQKLMAKKSEDRFATPDEAAEALRPHCRALDLPITGYVADKNTEQTHRDPSSQETTKPERVPISTIEVPKSMSLPQFGLNRRWIGSGLAGILLLTSIGLGIRDYVVHKPDDDRGRAVEPPKPPEPSLGPTALRWKNEFGRLPTGIPVPGRGTWRIEEDLRVISIQTDDSRLVQLGTTTNNDESAVSVDVELKRDGMGGLFFGFETDKADSPKEYLFNAILVDYAFPNGATREVRIHRLVGRLDAKTGRFEPHTQRYETITVDDNQNRINLSVRLKSGSIFSILADGQNCDKIVPPALGSFSTPHSGPFGLVGINGVVWFSNPRFERKD